MATIKNKVLVELALRNNSITTEHLDVVLAANVFQPTPIVEGIVLREGFYLHALGKEHFGQM